MYPVVFYCLIYYGVTNHLGSAVSRAKQIRSMAVNLRTNRNTELTSTYISKWSGYTHATVIEPTYPLIKLQSSADSCVCSLLTNKVLILREVDLFQLEHVFLVSLSDTSLCVPAAAR
jgi:hypothetical protein